MKRLNLCAISATLLLSVILQQPVSAQTRGSELYDLMGRERLTSTTGNSQVLW